MSARAVARLSREITACRHCVSDTERPPLPHEPKPIFRLSPTARIAICSQAPGNLAHQSGTPFLDPSGVRLREWMGVTEAEFYDATRVAIVPMGFCFPGYDAKGGDLPPRRECAPLWRQRALDTLSELEVLLLVGSYAQRWHLGRECSPTLTATVADWRRFAQTNSGPRVFPMPHPSWRNNAWLTANPWYARDVLPALKLAVRGVFDGV
ncbi:MAG: uracil-DNA glycosylase family protein [Pseudomonadota bacterium]